MRTFITLAIVLFAFNSFSQNPCDKVLERGVFNTHSFRNIKTLKNSLKRVTELSFDQFKSLVETSSVDAGLSALWGIISADANVEQQRKIYEKLKISYKEDFDFNINTHEEQEIVHVLASKDILDAWRDCIKSTNSISSTVQNTCEYCDNCEKNFTSSIVYKKKDGNDPKRVKIKNVTVQNASLVEPIVLRKGATIGEFSSITQQFSKSSQKLPVTVIVDFEGFGNTTIQLPSCSDRPVTIPPIVPPKNYVFELKTSWEIVDDDNNKPGINSGDEHCHSSYTQNITLIAGGNAEKITFSQCCDDEVRLDSKYALRVNEARELELLSGDIAIFEGNYCPRAGHERTINYEYRKFPIGDVEIIGVEIDDKQFDWGKLVVRAKLLTAN